MCLAVGTKMGAYNVARSPALLVLENGAKLNLCLMALVVSVDLNDEVTYDIRLINLT